MKPDIEVLSIKNTIKEVREWLKQSSKQKLDSIAVVGENEDLTGVIKIKEVEDTHLPMNTSVSELIKKQNIYVYNDSQLRFAVDLIDRFNINSLSVVDRNNKKKVVGVLIHKNILQPTENAGMRKIFINVLFFCEEEVISLS